MSIQPLNLFDFGEGHLEFRIKIPAHVTFKIGIIDSWGNQQYVEFPAHQTTYGLVRDGEWGRVEIPTQDIRGALIDLRMLSYAFVILEEQGASCEFAVDDIYWSTPTGIFVPEPVLWRGPGRMSGAPNPFNPETAIRFVLEGASETRVTIHGSDGRRVRTLCQGHRPAGEHVVRWNGTDDKNRALPSGTYLVRLEAEDRVSTSRLVLLK